MKNRIKIKVIKKEDQKSNVPEIVAEPTPPADDPTKLASTVSGWVNEFHERRREETETAREQFYS
jgi:hypothetical protein